MELEFQRKAQNLQRSQQFQNEGDAYSPGEHEKYSCYHLSKHSLIKSRVYLNRFQKYKNLSDIYSVYCRVSQSNSTIIKCTSKKSAERLRFFIAGLEGLER